MSPDLVSLVPLLEWGSFVALLALHVLWSYAHDVGRVAKCVFPTYSS